MATSEERREEQKPAPPTSRLPPFVPSKTRKISGEFKTIRRLPARYWLQNRDLVLGWPAPPYEVVKPLLDRYSKKYHLQSCLGYAYRFSLLLQQRLRCFEISAERCIPHDVIDPNPHGYEEARSFNCIAISTSREGQNLRVTRVTENQFRWLVQFFGAPPVWYWYFRPRYMPWCA